MKVFDVLVVGSGLSALTTALTLSPDYRVALLTRKTLKDCSSFHAQGGIAAAISEQDSLADHIEDTLIAGAGLCDAEAVEDILSKAPRAIDWLRLQGVDFNLADPEHLSLHKEGGHRHRRIVHVADATGQKIIQTLLKKILARENIYLFENHYAFDLLMNESGQKVKGLLALDTKADEIQHFYASHVILATGGASGLYPQTTYADAAIGDGIAMAFRAGAQVANLEFTQFHPTAFCCKNAHPFLITEALRGEGATLRTANEDDSAGDAFMQKYDPRGDLAPRDIVARAICSEMHENRQNFVWLDISHRDAVFIKQQFPMIYQYCLQNGIDMTRQPIPVAPAAHYSCGGIAVDALSKTTVLGLYAVGETAYTGLHGANRLASNSLLECLVSAFSVADGIHAQGKSELPVFEESPVTPVAVLETGFLTTEIEKLAHLMWQHVGIWRSKQGLQTALQVLTDMIKNLSGSLLPSTEVKQIELANRLLMSYLTTLSAQKRHESRGLHHRSDCPEPNPSATVHFIQKADLAADDPLLTLVLCG